MGRWFVVVLVGLVLVGCPKPDSGNGAEQAAAGQLKLDVDPTSRQTSKPEVGETIQLRLSWSDDPRPGALLNTLVNDGPNLPRWEVDPPGAVEIDPSTSRATLKTSGKVTIRAIYQHEGQDVQSNELNLDIQTEGQAKKGAER